MAKVLSLITSINIVLKEQASAVSQGGAKTRIGKENKTGFYTCDLSGCRKFYGTYLKKPSRTDKRVWQGHNNKSIHTSV